MAARSGPFAGGVVPGKIECRSDIEARDGNAQQVFIGFAGPGGEAGIAFGSGNDASMWRVAADVIGLDDTFEFTERADPSAPAANKARLYSKDNGGGKTQLVVRFPTGAVQVIATEP